LSGPTRALWMLLPSFGVVGMGMLLAAVPGELCPSAVVNVVAVENPYRSMLAQLSGQCVRVTSIINDPGADPHEFQTDVQVGKAYQTAALVVQNGLGYDAFSKKIIATLHQNILDGHPRCGSIAEVVNADRLSRLYGTAIQVPRTADGGLFIRGA
jgi:ABC-type Zn uptake system ZnuABC Zn-binding protein ZnuA